MNGDRAACFKLLREAGANLEATSSLRLTPLHEAAVNGRPDLLSLLIQSGVTVNATCIKGKTALHFAAHSYGGGRVDCADLLVKAGAAVNVRSVDGWTPLDFAINRGHRRMWPLLLRAGAEVPGYYSPMPNPYILRVEGAGGFKKYAQAHLARVTKIFESTLGLDARPARLVAEFWLHAGYY